MARGGPPLTKPFDINPFRGHALPARGRHRFGRRRINHHSPRDKSEPGPEGRTPEAGKNPRGTGVNFLGCSNLWRPQPRAAAALRAGRSPAAGRGAYAIRTSVVAIIELIRRLR